MTEEWYLDYHELTTAEVVHENLRQCCKKCIQETFIIYFCILKTVLRYFQRWDFSSAVQCSQYGNFGRGKWIFKMLYLQVIL